MTGFTDEELLAHDGKAVRFFADAQVLPHCDLPPVRGRHATKTITIPLSLARNRSPSQSSSLPSPSLTKEDGTPYSFKRYDPLEDEAFTPNPPRMLRIRMPTLSRRKRSQSVDIDARSCLRSSQSASKVPRTGPAPNDPCPIVHELPTLPYGSPLNVYHPTAASPPPASPTSVESAAEPATEPLRSCCNQCGIAYAYGLLPNYTERFSASAKRKLARDQTGATGHVDGAVVGKANAEAPKSPGLNDDGDVPLPAHHSLVVDELAKYGGGSPSLAEDSEDEEAEEETTAPLCRAKDRHSTNATKLPLGSINEVNTGEGEVLRGMRRSATVPATPSSAPLAAHVGPGMAALRPSSKSDTAPVDRLPLQPAPATRPKPAKKWSSVFSLGNFSVPAANPSLRGW